jgi:hypothetical protein
MISGPVRLIGPALALGAALVMFHPATQVLLAQTDLDAFMREVLARRDDNWKKLQQYVLDEREEIEVRGPTGAALFGDRREYSWYLRDGFFVRSPVKANGVTIGEDDRRKAEAEYLRRVQRRDARQRNREGQPTPAAAPDEAPRDIEGLIRQTRDPEFISSAYFLRFRFDGGQYALVGREELEGTHVLRIEYYPTKLFNNPPVPDEKPKAFENEIQRLMNKTSLVTLWIEPEAHQIIKYKFDNLGMEFLPAQWLVRVTGLNASMTMGQPFPSVWLPRSLEVRGALAMALGPIDFRYSLAYHDYRQADVRSTLIVPER